MIMLNYSKLKLKVGEKLKKAYFDKSSYNREDKSWTVGCSCCKALVINGVPCHEIDCPNLKKAQSEKE